MTNSEKIARVNELYTELCTLLKEPVIVATLEDVGRDKETVTVEWHNAKVRLNPRYYGDDCITLVQSEPPYKSIIVGPPPKPAE